MAWTKREALDGVYNVRGANNNIGTFVDSWNGTMHTNDEPRAAHKNNSLMHAEVATMFYSKAVRIAEARHGAIYEVRANLTHLRSLLSQTPAAFVSRGVSPKMTDAHVILKVSRMSPSSDWASWLSYRVREAKMHDAIYHKLVGRKVEACMFVPAMYFAGVDRTTGLYYTVMQRPPGTLASIADLIKDGKFTMNVYRALEASVGAVWSVGAMLCDVSAGNVLVSSRGLATIVDFDSSIVYPQHVRNLLYQKISSLRTGLVHGKCLHIKKSSHPEYVRIWDLVMRPNNGDAILKKLAIQVYGRKSWLPDVTMLRLLFEVAVTAHPTSSSSPSERRRLFAPIKKFFTPLRRDTHFEFPKLRLRHMAALPEEIKKEWRPRRHGGREPHEPVVNVRNLVRNTRVRNNNNNGNATNRTTTPRAAPVAPVTPVYIPVQAVQAGSAIQGPNPNLLELTKNQSRVFDKTIENNNASMPRAPNNASQKTSSNITAKDYIEFKKLPKDRKQEILDVEVERYKATDTYKKLVDDLLKGTTQGGYYAQGQTVLNYILKQKFPGVRWADDKKSKNAFRREHVDDVATDILQGAVKSVLEEQYAGNAARTKQYGIAMKQKLRQVGASWFRK